MCGIAGLCDFSKNSDLDQVRSMTDIMTHRGPNDSGYQIMETPEALIGFGHRRLSILDLSSGGHQPMDFEYLKIIFNGEIYNFQEIRLELEKLGYTFHSSSDTEVILKGYHCWGIGIIDKCIGMFAMAILDRKRNELILIRDRAGIKPLYYYWDGNLMLFSSELKSMHRHSGFKKKIDIHALALFLQYSYIPGPYSIFEKVSKLEPGHYLKFRLAQKEFQVIKYWDVLDFYNRPKSECSDQEAMDRVESLMRSSYEYRMVSDVPVGVFLSGGYDSTSVAAILQTGRTDRIRTFTIGYREAGFNEAEEAKKIAKFLGTDHTEWYVSARDASGIMEKLPEIYDEPFADNSTVPTILVSQLASRTVKVALSADGGDEIFAGYSKFNQARRFTSQYPTWFRKALGNAMERIDPERIPVLKDRYNFSTRYEKMKMIWKSGNPANALKFISQYTTESQVRKFLSVEFKNYPTHFDLDPMISADNDPINRMLAIDYKTFLVDNNLVKVDRATMSVSLEGREPMLDHRLIEFLSGLPSEIKIRKGVNKFLLKAIVHKYVPRELMDRPKKPFIAPLTIWFRDELRDQMEAYLNPQTLARSGLLHVQPILDLKRNYLEGGRVSYQKLWNILVFLIWHEKWMGPNS